jgi:putative transposase
VAAGKLLEAKEGILVYKTFLEEHYRSIHSVNRLERINRERRRRTRVVGGFPDRSSLYRLVSTRLVNTDKDWRAGRSFIEKEGVERIFTRSLERKTKNWFMMMR